MRVIGITIIFEGAEVRAFPLTDGGHGAVELTERLPEFCRLVLSSTDIVCCVAGLHGHTAGDCARR